MIIKNPKKTKNSSEEVVRKHIFTCLNCSCVFISLNSLVGKYCSRECASTHRKGYGWKHSGEARKKISEVNKGRKHSEETLEKLRKNISKEDLIRVYLDESKTQTECAKIFGCSISTISRYLKKYDLLGIKSNQEAQLTKSSNKCLYSNKDWLYQKYFIEKKTTQEIADLSEAGKTTIKRWLKKHGIKTRTNSEAQSGYYENFLVKR